MKAISKTLLLALLVMMGQQAFAQKEEKTLLRTEQMAVRLGLDENQKVQLDKQLKEAQEQRKEKMEKIRAMREEMRRDAFVERQAQHERLKEILTPEQLEKLEAMKAERAERGGERFGNRGGQRMNRADAMKFRQRRQQMMKKRLDRPDNPKEKKGGN